MSINNKTFYFSEEGIRQYGWQEIDGVWYYFGSKSKGYMYKNAWIKENGKNTYYVGSDGSRCKGWYTGKNTYYFDKNGRLVTGYKKIKGVKYRFDAKGRMTSNGPKFSLNSQCAILVEADSGKVIYSKNLDLRHANASTTKIMTAILAVEIGCSNTHFATPNGLDAGLDHYTTARDVAKIASYAWQYSKIRQIVGTRTRTIKNLKGKSYNLVSTNLLLHEGMAGIGGMKTGFTNKARQCFVGVIQGLHLLFTVTGKGRFA